MLIASDNFTVRGYLRFSNKAVIHQITGSGSVAGEHDLFAVNLKRLIGVNSLSIKQCVLMSGSSINSGKPRLFELNPHLLGGGIAVNSSCVLRSCDRRSRRSDCARLVHFRHSRL